MLYRNIFLNAKNINFVGKIFFIKQLIQIATRADKINGAFEAAASFLQQ